MEKLRAFIRSLGDVKIPPPKIPPIKPPTGGTGPNGGGGGEDPLSAQERLAKAIEAQAKRLAELKKKYSADEVRDEHAATEALIDEIARLQKEKVKLRTIDASQFDAALKKEVAAQKAAVDKELALLHSLAKEKASVINEGAGARVGILGLNRKVENAPGTQLQTGGGGLVAANAALQLGQALGPIIADLSQPFVALDTATAQLRTLGEEGAQLAEPLRDAAIVMSKDLPFAAAELQSVMFDALASGVKGGEEGLKAFADTAAKLATGGGADIGQATTLLAGQLNAYGKSAEEAGRFADIFFNTVNFGVTSIPELSSTLANVIPTAAGAGIELENVGAALALMTQKGIPTAQSTTKLNQLLIELQKPGAALAPILKNAGVSLESLKQEDLPVTLAKVQNALALTGKAAVQVFGSSEAAAAFQVLAGDIEGFRQTFEDVRDTTGSAENAYKEMSTSIEVRTKQMLSTVNAFVIQGLDKLGSGFVAAAQAGSQLAPIVGTLAGVKQILPEGAFSGLGAKISGVGKSISSLIPGLGAVGSAGSAAGAATGAGFTAALGPVGLILAAIALVVGGFVLLYKNSESFRKSVDGIVDKVKAVASAIVDAVLPVVEQMFSLIGDVGGLVIDVLVTQFEAVGAAISYTIGLLENVADGLAGLVGGSFEIRDAFEFIRNSIISVQALIAGLREQFKALKDVVGDAFSLLLKGDVVGAVESFAGIGEKTGSAFSRGFQKKAVEEIRNTNISEGTKALEEQLQIGKGLDASKAVDELRKQLREASSEAEKANIANQIAAKVPEAVRGVTRIVDEYGNVVNKAILSEEALDREKKAMLDLAGSEEDRAERQTKVVEGMISGLNVLDEEKRKRDELDAQAAEARLRFGDGSEEAKAADAALASQQKVVEERTKQITDAFNQGTKAGLFKDLPAETQARFTQAKEVAFKSFFDGIESRAAETKIGEIIGEGAKISGDLDINKQVAQAIEGLKTAKTEAERNNFAKVIADNAPGAINSIKAVVDENGNLVKQYDVNVDKAKELNAAERSVLESRQGASSGEFIKLLQTQSQAAADAKAEFDKLQEKVVESQKTSGKVGPELQKAYDGAKKKMEESTRALSTNIAEGRRLGLVKGTVDDLAKGFGGSARAAFGTADAIAQVDIKAKQGAQSAEDLAKKLQEGFNAAQKLVNENVDAIIEIQLRARAEGRRLTAEEEADIKKKSELARKSNTEVRTIEKARRDLRRQLGIDEEKTEKKRRELLTTFDSNLAKLRLDAFKLFYERSLRQLKDAGLRELLQLKLNLRLARETNETELTEADNEIARIKIARDQATDAQEKARLRNDLIIATRRRNALRALNAEEEKDATEAIATQEERLRENLASELLLAGKEAFDAETEQFAQQAEALTTATVRDAEERFDKLADVERRRFDARVRDILAQSQVFKALFDRDSAEAQASFQEQLRLLAEAQNKLIEEQRRVEADQTIDPEDVEERLRPYREALDRITADLEAARSRVATIATDLRDRLLSFIKFDPAQTQEVRNGEAVVASATKTLIDKQAELAASVDAGTIDRDQADAQLQPLIEARVRAIRELRDITEAAREANRQSLSQFLRDRNITDPTLVSQITAAVVAAENTAAKTRRERESTLRALDRQARIAGARDDAEKERLQKVADIERTRDDELAAIEAASSDVDERLRLLAENRRKVEADATLDAGQRFEALEALAGAEAIFNQDVERFREARFAVELRARRRLAELDAASEKEKTGLLAASLNLQTSLLDAFRKRSEEITKQGIKSKREALKQEEADLAQSYRLRLITATEYAERSAKIDAERAQLAIANEDFVDAFVRGARQALAAFTVKINEQTNERLETLAINHANHTAVVEQLTAEIAEAGRKGETDKVLALTELKKKAIEDENSFYLDVALNTSVQVGALLGTMLARGETDVKKFLAVVVDATFNAIQAVIPGILAEFLGVRLVATAALPVGGTAIAIAEWIGATALLEGIISAARASIKLADGAIGVGLSRSFVGPNGRVSLAGPGTETSDSIPALLSRGESVITARATKAGSNAAALEWLNRTGRDLAEFYRPKTPTIIADTGAAVVVQHLQAQQAETAEAVRALGKDVRNVKGAVESFARVQTDLARSTVTELRRGNDADRLGY